MVVPTETPSQSAGAGGKTPAAERRDECKRRHENGAQAQFRCLNGRFGDGATFLAQLFGKLDDQNGVLGGKARLASRVLSGNRRRSTDRACTRPSAPKTAMVRPADNERERENSVLAESVKIDNQKVLGEDGERLAAGHRFRRVSGRSTRSACRHHWSC